MEEHSFERSGRLSVQIEPQSHLVAPGNRIAIPIVLQNRATVDQVLELSVRGIPATWVSVPSPVVRLAPGEQRELSLTIQPPPLRPGQHVLVVRAANQEEPGTVAEAECQLTVAAYEAPGRIGVLLGVTEFMVLPGEGVNFPIVLSNRGLEADSFQLSVEGIPTTWVSTPSPVTHLGPGEHREVSLTIQPPRSMQSRAGRHAFKVCVLSQAAPGQMAEVECTLTIGVFGQFQSELRPQRVQAGQPARVIVENLGNTQQAYTIAWQSLNDELAFEPAQIQELRVPAGQASMLEFRAVPRSRPLFGGERSYAYTARVQSADAETQNLSGEVLSRGSVPSWILPVAIILIMAAACLAALLLFGGDQEGRPTDVAPATATEVAPAPTDVAPTEMPTEAPSTEPPPEPAPTEERPTEETPVEPTQEPPIVPTEGPPGEPTREGGEGSGPELPCLPVAGAIVLLPLLMTWGRKPGRNH